MRKLIFYILFFSSQAIFSQESKKSDKETIFIMYDVKNKDNKEVNINSETFIFYTGKNGYFVHNGLEQTKKCFSEIYIPKLITEKIAFEKILAKKKKYVEEWKLKNPKNIPPPVIEMSYNSYFEKIFLYKRINSNEGILYEVNWYNYRGIE